MKIEYSQPPILRSLMQCFVAICFSLFAGVVNAAPRVVVSITPVHSLVSAVMQGVAEPVLLISGGQSPHLSSLKPSALGQLAHADLLVWLSPEFELGLEKPAAQRRTLQILTLIDEPAINILPLRQSTAWRVDNHSHYPEPGSPEIEIPDMHVWLSSENAAEIVTVVEKKLSKLDPDNIQLYQSNAQQAIDKIHKTRRIIERSLQSIKQAPYLVFHDAYQYFENEFQLKPVGAVTLNPDRKPGIKTLLAIKKNIVQDDVRCIFHEPQFQPRLVSRIAEETGIRTGELDPIGADLQPGPDLWFELMLSLRDGLLDCFGEF